MKPQRLSLSLKPASSTMAAMQDPGQQDNVSLEARMRNLILKNSDQAQAPGAAADVPRSSSQPLIPSAIDSSASGPQQDTQGQPKQAQRPGRKRMNQAQRRQMSSQLSVDIDPRAAGPQPSHYRGQSAGNYQRNSHVNQQGRNHRSQSAAFQSPYVNASHARHQPSPSLPAFAPQPTLFDWRQPGGSAGFNGAQPAFSRTSHASRNSTSQIGSSYSPRPYYPRAEDLGPQIALLENLSAEILANAEIAFEQIQEKENFRLLIEDACRVAIARHEQTVNGQADFPPMSVQLQCFGSLSSGFATKSSDMDLGLLSPYSYPHADSPDSPIPRIVEKTFLDMGIGARLLSKTRVPIIKVCQKPTEKLYSDLLEEREKWEKGGEEDHEVEDEEAEHKPTPNSGRHSQKTGNTSADDQAQMADDNKVDSNTATTINDDHGIDQYQTLLDELKQGAKSLPNYYGAAKKTLRKLGGKDITNSTAANFGAEDFRILNDVCKAFIHGLADDTLRTRLEAYASLAFDEQAAVPNNRSIFGVMAQIEGEKLVMACESRTILERNDHCEQLARNRVIHWRELQNRPNFGLDPLGYNKDLLSATEYLKKIPSIGLLLLEQGQYESAASYHNRTLRLLTDLGGNDLPSSQSPVLPVVLRQYSQGIYDFGIRAQVSDWLKSNPSANLRALARRHKSLQLAREFERALEKGLYSTEIAKDIQAYIEILRGPMLRSAPEDVYYDSILSIAPEQWALVARIREIPDPSRMSPNLPRDPYRDKLEFPNSGIGVQCDINFSAQLAIHNTHLLRCYSLTDPRVRPLVLFVKHWAKVRGINTSYRGTLSSYGYVLMVLHYLINVAQPSVCPNLQAMAPPVDPHLRPEQIENMTICQGRYVWFWKNEDEIKAAAKQGGLTQNRDSIGHLLRGFFEYYAQGNMMSTGHMRGFDWGRDVISLRTPGGILSKQTKGWTGAKTVLEVQSADKPPAVEPEMPQANPVPGPQVQGVSNSTAAPQLQQSQDPAAASAATQDRSKHEVKEVRHRYLFAIEDPFELDHNVARTVTHNGIVSIRDEFRRAWRIIRNAGKHPNQENLLQDASLDVQAEHTSFAELIDEIHGQQSA